MRSRRILVGVLVVAVLAAVPAAAQQLPRTSSSITAGGADCSVAARCVTLNVGIAADSAAVLITGTWTATPVVEIAINPAGAWTLQPETFNLATGAASSTIPGNGYYVVPLRGAQAVRVRANTFGSGPVTVAIGAAPASGGVAITQPLPAGSATIGAVTVGTSALPTGAATSAAQTTGNASLASLDGKVPALGQALAVASVPVVLTAAQIATLTPLASISVSNFPAMQPVSGTVTANAGTGTFTVGDGAGALTVDGTVAVTGVSTLAEQQTQTTALQLVDNLPLAQNAATAGQSGVLVQGAVTTNAPTYTTAQTSPLSLTPAGAVRTDASATTQPVSGALTTAGPVTWDGVTPTALETAATGAAGTLTLNTAGAGCAIIWIRPTSGSTFTGGSVVFEMTANGGTSWEARSASNGDTTYTTSPLFPATDFTNGAEAGWAIPAGAHDMVRVRLATAITGTGGSGAAGTPTFEVSGDASAASCTPFTIARQSDPRRLNVSARNYTSTSAGSAVWTSATAVDTRAEITTASLSTVFVTIRPTGTITGGIITTELSDLTSPASTDWFTAPGQAQMSLAGMVSTGQTSFTVSVPASTKLAIRLVTAITGSSSPGVSIVMIASSGAPVRTSTVNFKTGFVMTTAALGVSGVYTSAWMDNQNDGTQAVVCYARSNVASAASGFVLQQSTDPSDANFTITAYSTTANAATTTAAFMNTYQRYWRVVYTNGGTGQTTGKIVCSLNPVQFTQTDSIGVTYTNPTLYQVYDNGVSGSMTQRITQSQELTYSAGTTLKTNTTAGTGVIFNVCGSATKTVRVQRISLSGSVATAAIYGDIVIKKTSTATGGGTARTLTNAPYDSNNAAATAVAKYYTVLGTAGTSVGVVLAQTIFFPLTGTPAATGDQLRYSWRDPDSEAPTLRGTAQCLEVSFGTTPTNVPTLSASVVWTEK